MNDVAIACAQSEINTPTIEDIIHTLCNHFGIEPIEIIGKTRSWNVIYPRHIGYYLSSKLIGLPACRIAREFGHRDHTTILYGIKKIALLLEQESYIKYDIQFIQEQLYLLKPEVIKAKPSRKKPRPVIPDGAIKIGQKDPVGSLLPLPLPEIVLPEPEDKFALFWKAYPRRKGANPREPARKVWMTALKAGNLPEDIIAGAARCAEVDRENINTPFIPQAVKWLRDKRWKDYPPSEAIQNRPETALCFVSLGSPQWEAWERYYRVHGGPGGRKISPPHTYDRELKQDGWRFPTPMPPEVVATQAR